MRTINAQLQSKSPKRHEGVKRVLLLMELIQPLRRGATLQELHRDVRDELGNVCERTVHRDLSVLVSLNLIQKVVDRYVWTQHRRASLFQAVIREVTELSETDSPWIDGDDVVGLTEGKS